MKENLDKEITTLKTRLVALQDRFIDALNHGEGTEDDRAPIAEMLSWALSTESILSSLRVEIMLHTGDDQTNAMDLVSTIRKQIAETEEKLNIPEGA